MSSRLETFFGRHWERIRSSSSRLATNSQKSFNDSSIGTGAWDQQDTIQSSDLR